MTIQHATNPWMLHPQGNAEEYVMLTAGAEGMSRGASVAKDSPAAIDWSQPVETKPCEGNPLPLRCIVLHEGLDGERLVLIPTEWHDPDDIRPRSRAQAYWFDRRGQGLTVHCDLQNAVCEPQTQQPKVLASC